MAKLKTPPFMDRLASALINALEANGIEAEVSAEPVKTTQLYRVAVLANKFNELKHSERQNLVWRIAERALSSDEVLRISMILTLTPNEVDTSKVLQWPAEPVKRQGWKVFGKPAKTRHQ